LNWRMAALETTGQAAGSRLTVLETGGSITPPAGLTSVVSLTQRVLTLERAGRGGGPAPNYATIPDLFGSPMSPTVAMATMGTPHIPHTGPHFGTFDEAAPDPRLSRIEAKVRDLCEHGRIHFQIR
jgi:hypothetical protein